MWLIRGKYTLYFALEMILSKVITVTRPVKEWMANNKFSMHFEVLNPVFKLVTSKMWSKRENYKTKWRLKKRDFKFQIFRWVQFLSNSLLTCIFGRWIQIENFRVEKKFQNMATFKKGLTISTHRKVSLKKSEVQSFSKSNVFYKMLPETSNSLGWKSWNSDSSPKFSCRPKHWVLSKFHP